MNHTYYLAARDVVIGPRATEIGDALRAAYQAHLPEGASIGRYDGASRWRDHAIRMCVGCDGATMGRMFDVPVSDL